MRELTVQHPPASALDAIVRGTADGIPVLVGIAAVLLVAVALVTLLNMALGALPLTPALSLQRDPGLAVAPGDVADRHSVAGERGGGDADGAPRRC